jgi:HPt (histidine-containing phosphotransfer) domain-containing protein
LTDPTATLDAHALANLRQLDPLGRSGLISKLKLAFERSAQRLEVELTEAMAAGPDLERVRRAAHTLKSASANLAALTLSAHCQAVEVICRQGDVDALESAVAQLQQHLAQARAAVQALS